MKSKNAQKKMVKCRTRMGSTHRHGGNPWSAVCSRTNLQRKQVVRRSPPVNRQQRPLSGTSALGGRVGARRRPLSGTSRTKRYCTLLGAEGDRTPICCRGLTRGPLLGPQCSAPSSLRAGGRSHASTSPRGLNEEVGAEVQLKLAQPLRATRCSFCASLETPMRRTLNNIV